MIKMKHICNSFNIDPEMWLSNSRNSFISNTCCYNFWFNPFIYSTRAGCFSLRWLSLWWGLNNRKDLAHPPSPFLIFIIFIFLCFILAAHWKILLHGGMFYWNAFILLQPHQPILNLHCLQPPFPLSILELLPVIFSSLWLPLQLLLVGSVARFAAFLAISIL